MLLVFALPVGSALLGCLGRPFSLGGLARPTASAPAPSASATLSPTPLATASATAWPQTPSPGADLPIVSGSGSVEPAAPYPAPSALPAQVAAAPATRTPTATLTMTPTTTLSPTPRATYDPFRCPNVVHRDGDQLVLNGKPIVFVGLNVTSLMDPGLPEAEIPAILDTLQGWGVTMVRVWVQPGADLDRFGRILNLATSRNIRFLVTLQDYYHYKSVTWFSTTYKTEDLPHIERVVTRFRGRPEIAIWEVMNEPWCGAEGEVADPACYRVLQTWAEETTALIRKLDPCRPISLGLLGARHLPIEQEAYRALSAIETVDLLSMHRAPRDWYNDPVELEIAGATGKPLLLGEVAVVGYGTSCEQLGPFVVPDRARLIEEDMRKALELGLAGYLLWDYAPGAVQVDGGQVRYFCSIYGYDKYDPVGPLIKALPFPRVAITR